MSSLTLPNMRKNPKGKKPKGRPPRAGSVCEKKAQGELSDEDYNQDMSFSPYKPKDEYKG